LSGSLIFSKADSLSKTLPSFTFSYSVLRAPVYGVIFILFLGGKFSSLDKFEESVTGKGGASLLCWIADHTPLSLFLGKKTKPPSNRLLRPSKVLSG